MIAPPRPPITSLPVELRLPVSLLTRYVLFLTRRPISASNPHYLGRRLEGLRTLSEPLSRSDVPCLHEAVRQLHAMNPANFYRLAEQLQGTLLPLAPAITELPRDFVVSGSTPRPELLAGARRLLLLAGPAIGVGDELILFPLPGWLKAVNPDVEITVMSAYGGLWDRVDEVDRRVTYGAHAEMLDAIRGEGPGGRYDVVMLADFERPDLHPAICAERPVDCYVELSLGGRSGVLVDSRNRWLHRARGPLPYASNFYFGLPHLAGWLGLDAGLGDRRPVAVRRRAQPPRDRLRVYVNAFTSKYDPSAVYWSRLLSLLFQQAPERPVEIVVDPGTNSQTQAFALALVRSASARTAAGVTMSVARPSAGTSMSFEDVFSQMEQAQVVICTDSFPAHAAPLFGCATLVIADVGLETWRVPFRPVYYLRAQAGVESVAAGMRQVLSSVQTAGGEALPLAGLGPELELEASTRRLRQLLAGDHHDEREFGSLCEAYQDFSRSYQTVAERLPEWPAEFEELFADVDYLESLDAPEDGAGVPASLRGDFAFHLQNRWQWWQNTNLRKYLGMALQSSAVRQRSADPAPPVQVPS
jgi:hypothetical protein